MYYLNEDAEVIEAVQYFGFDMADGTFGFESNLNWIDDKVIEYIVPHIERNDYIIRDIVGRIYFCSKKTFLTDYTKIDDYKKRPKWWIKEVNAYQNKQKLISIFRDILDDTDVKKCIDKQIMDKSVKEELVKIISKELRVIIECEEY